MLEYLKTKSDWLFPHTIAEKASNGLWIAYKHLKYISIKIARAIAKGNARILLETYPGAGKSEFVSHWLPFWYFHLWPDNRLILTSYAADVAKQWGALVRDEIQNNEYSELRVSQDSEAKSDWKIAGRRGSMTTAGIGGQVTSKHAELMILDDTVKNWEEASSSTMQERNINWWRSTFLTRLEPRGSIIVLGTTWHPKDLLGFIESSSDKRWEIIKLPALATKNDPMGRKEGEALCPERHDVLELEQRAKDSGSFMFSALYQCSPSIPQGNLVKRESFKRYDLANKPKFDTMFADADLTFKKTDEGSFVVIQVWGTLGEEFFLVHQFRGRIGFKDQCDELNKTKKMFPQIDFIYIEDAASAQAALDTLKHEVRGIKLVRVDSDKISRFLNIQPTIENMRLNIPYGSMGDAYIDELCMFPKSEHNDQVDATSIGIGQRQHRMKIISAVLTESRRSTFKNI